MDIILYKAESHCPRCEVLHNALKAKSLEHKVVTDSNTIAEKGFLSAPILEVNGVAMTFTQAYQWVLGGVYEV